MLLVGTWVGYDLVWHTAASADTVAVAEADMAPSAEPHAADGPPRRSGVAGQGHQAGRPATDATNSNSQATPLLAWSQGAAGPSMPTQVVVERAGDGQVLVSWSMAGAEVTTSFTAEATGSGSRCTVVAANWCRITGLANGRSYRFRVVASDGANESPSPWTDEMIAAMAPGRPTAVVAEALGDGQVLVSWQAPPRTGGLPIRGYRVVANRGGPGCSFVSATSCQIGGIVPGRGYSFAVAAITEAGESVTSVGSAPIEVQ